MHYIFHQKEWKQLNQQLAEVFQEKYFGGWQYEYGFGYADGSVPKTR